jgi:signal transduction histidine kinase
MVQIKQDKPESMASGDVMVIDDNPVNLNLLKEILSQKGYVVRPFPKGDIAVMSAQTNPPGLILLDIMMPDLDGYEVCQMLKSNEATYGIPVIFISAKTVTIDKIKAFNVGGVDYITKPFQVEEVLARVKTHLTLRRYQLESDKKNEELQNMLSKLKFAQSQLIQSEKMASIGILAAGIAHELNNPINFISISTKGLKKKFSPIIELLQQLDGSEKTFEQFEEMGQAVANLDLSSRLQAINELTTNIETGADRSVEIVNGLRSFSRLDKSTKEKTNIHKSLEAALIILKSQTKGVIAIVKDFEELPGMMAFPGKLTQVFMNIIKNGIDAINACTDNDRDKVITIKTRATNSDNSKYACIQISDSGHGISEEAEGRLFDPFFTTKEVGKGTGLGLSIALGIIEDHQGRIEVSDQKGNGTRFTVFLPL